MAKSRRKTFSLTLSFLLIGILTIFITPVLAEQPRYSALDSQNNLVTEAAYQKYYTPTNTKSTLDGVANYPYEIYFVNEQRPDNYRIHSNYSKNSDACASCHSTHTAVGNSLLQWQSVYDTCLACHDGTLSNTYNVVDGRIRSTDQPTFGGRFGVSGEGVGEDLSNHNVTGAIKLTSAPGGSVTEVAYTMGNKTVTRWGTNLGCESCHEPHGLGGNARILSPDPNYMQTVRGKRDYTNFTFTRAAETISGNVYYTAKDNSLGYLYLLKNYPYTSDLKIYLDQQNGNPVEQLYLDQDFTLDNNSGYSKLIFNLPNRVAPEAGYRLYGSFISAWKVKMAINNYLGYEGSAGETVSYQSGINGFCGSCHTLFNNSTNDMLSGQYSGSHKVGGRWAFVVDSVNLKFENVIGNSGTIVCLTCHVAHGVSKKYWTETLNSTQYGNINENLSSASLNELGGSSALKRKPNYNLCPTCHGGTSDSWSDLADPPSESVIVQTNAAYVGSAACVSCHAQYDTGWKNTNHAQSVVTVPADVKDLFADTVIAGASYTKSDLLYQSGKYLIARSKTAPYSGRLAIIAVYENGAVTPEATPGAYETDCAACHLTGRNLKVNTTTAMSWANPGVSCEACHGPGSSHIQDPLMGNITNPRRLTITRQTEICAQCHVYAGYDKRYYYDQAVNKFIYATTGNAYLQSGKLRGFNGYQFYKSGVTVAGSAYVYSDPNVNPNINPRNDSLLYSDAVSAADHSKYGPQYEEFLNSEHYTSGNMSCITCHQSHGRNSEGSELKMAPAAICASCHDSVMDLNRYMNPEYTDQGTNQNKRIEKTHTFKQPEYYLDTRAPNP